jgi:hypothetical protein
MVKRSLVPEGGGLRVGAIRSTGSGLVIEGEPREPPQHLHFMAYASSLEGC